VIPLETLNIFPKLLELSRAFSPIFRGVRLPSERLQFSREVREKYTDPLTEPYHKFIFQPLFKPDSGFFVKKAPVPCQFVMKQKNGPAGDSKSLRNTKYGKLQF